VKRFKPTPPSPLFQPHLCSTHSANPVTLPPEWAAEHAKARYLPIPADHVDERHRPPEPTSTATEFRHGHWAAARERVRRAMVDAAFATARRYGFQTCGGNPLVQIDAETGQVRVSAHCCHDRWCRACGRTRRQRLAAALTPLVSARKTLAVVLTLKSRDEPLGDSLTRLIDCFADLRKTKWWQENVRGGAWVFEVTHPPETGLWHPHLHILLHSCWLGLAELSAAWHTVTGDSHRVHVSEVRNDAQAIREVTKYAGKITHRTWDQDQALLAHAMTELNGRRLCSTFGSWAGTQLQPVDANVDNKQWVTWGSLDQLYALDASGSPEAKAIKRALVTGEPMADVDLEWEILARAVLGHAPGPAPPAETIDLVSAD
jgi:hypothetical protein